MQGHKSFLQISSPEASYGAATSPEHRIEIAPPFNFDVDYKKIPDPSLYFGVSRREFYPGMKLAQGKLSTRLNYEGRGILELLRMILPTYSCVVVESGVNDHFFKEGSTLKSYGLDSIEGDIPTGRAFRGSGVMCASATVRGNAGEMLFLDLDIVGKDKLSDQFITPYKSLSIGTLSTTNANPALTRGSGSFVTDGVKIGDRISGPGIPVGTTVSTVVALTVTMSLNATATASGTVTAVFTAQALDGGTATNTTITRVSPGSYVTEGVKVGDTISGTNVQAGTTITAVATTTLTLSLATTGTTANVALSVAHPFAAANPALYHTQNTLFDDGTPDAAALIRALSFSVTIPNPITTEDAFFGLAGPDDIVRSNFSEPTWEIRQRFKSKTLFEAGTNFTESSPKLVFKQGSIGATSQREFEIRSNRCNVTHKVNIEGYGPIVATSTHVAKNDVGVDDSSVVIRVRSTEAALP